MTSPVRSARDLPHRRARPGGLLGGACRLVGLVTALATLTAGCVSQALPAVAQGPAGPVEGPSVGERGTVGGAPLPVISRAGWAERPPILSRLQPMGRPWRITVHHEGAEPEPVASEAEVAERLRAITRSQERTRSRGGLGAGDLAYHFVIDRAGRLWEGRSLAWQGAHAGNRAANAGNIGVVLLGNFDLQRPSPEQLTSLERLLEDLYRRYRISPEHIYGHDQVRAGYGLPPTRCPGRYLSAWLDNYRSQAAGARAAR